MSANYDLVGPFRGPCGICGGPDARHRTYDNVRSFIRGGDPVEVIADNYDQTVEWVQAIVDDPESEWELTVRGSTYLNSNRVRHHFDTGRLVKEWRENAKGAALAAKLPSLQRAHIYAYVQFRDRRRHDAGNWYPTAKACVDGMIDAGLLPDDSDKHLVGPDMRPNAVTSPIPTIVFEIHDLGEVG